jgi:RNA polymerase sigma-70 factor, ECF subfamily
MIAGGPVGSPQAYGDAADEALVALSAGGDRRAFHEIVARHGPFALRVARRLLSDRLAAEDVVQDAMVRAWSQAGRFDPARAQFRTWLYRIVVNLCLDQRRRIQPESLPDDVEFVDPAPAPDEILAARQRDVALAAALRELPARERAAMTLVYDEELSAAETARILGASAKAVERLLARARARLRERMQAVSQERESR